MDDPAEMKAIRCEAGYHLAAVELGAGRGAEVQKIAEGLLKIDPANAFSERAFMLRPPGAAAAPAAGTLTLPSAH
jgi:hypothetical protein